MKAKQVNTKTLTLAYRKSQFLVFACMVMFLESSISFFLINISVRNPFLLCLTTC